MSGMLASAGGKGPAVWAVISCKATSVWCNVCHATGGAWRCPTQLRHEVFPVRGVVRVGKPRLFSRSRQAPFAGMKAWHIKPAISWARVVVLRGVLTEPAAHCCGFMCLGSCCSGLWCVGCFWRAWLDYAGFVVGWCVWCRPCTLAPPVASRGRAFSWVGGLGCMLRCSKKQTHSGVQHWSGWLKTGAQCM